MDLCHSVGCEASRVLVVGVGCFGFWLFGFVSCGDCSVAGVLPILSLYLCSGFHFFSCTFFF